MNLTMKEKKKKSQIFNLQALCKIYLKFVFIYLRIFFLINLSLYIISTK